MVVFIKKIVSEREIECFSGGGAERAGETESEASSFRWAQRGFRTQEQ